MFRDKNKKQQSAIQHTQVNGTSKKLALATAAISAVAACDTAKTQIIIAIIAVAFLTAQTFLDYVGKNDGGSPTANQDNAATPLQNTPNVPEGPEPDSNS